MHGTQNRLDFLPEQHTDFIFAVFSEEWGFFGCADFAAALLIMVAYCIGLVQRAKDRFGALLVFGMITIVFWHVAINVAMVAGRHAGGRRAVAAGELWRLGARFDDVRHRRDHERQHAALCFLTSG